MSLFFNIALVLLSTYFFDEGSYFLGVIALVWLGFRVLGNSIKLINSKVDLNTNANVMINFRINFAEVLKSDEVLSLFQNLKKRTKFHYESKEKWTDSLIENFKKAYKVTEDSEYNSRRYVWQELKFCIKGNLLFKDEKVDFNDTVFHEWFVPHVYEGKEDMFKSITTGITVRILIVNGFAKLQIGDFDKDSSPEVLDSGSLAAYRRYTSISEFPLIYFSYEHAIPEKYLHLSMYSTESYWRRIQSRKEIGDFTEDWKKINAIINDYNFVCRFADDSEIKDSEQKKWQEIVKRFEEVKEVELEKWSFKNLSYRSPDDYYVPEQLENTNIEYCNKYITVFVANHKDFKEKMEKFVYPDYYKETL